MVDKSQSLIIGLTPFLKKMIEHRRNLEQQLEIGPQMVCKLFDDGAIGVLVARRQA